MAQSTPPPESYQPDTTCRRIQVSREKRPLNFFVTLSKKFLLTDPVIELSGLGLAVTTVVTIAEILRSDGLVNLQHIQTSLVEPHPEGHTTAPKAKIQIWIRKTPEFDSLITNHNSNMRSYNPSQQASADDASSPQDAADTNLSSTDATPEAEHPPDE